MASRHVNLYEAKTQLSSLVDRAAKGEEIVIAKAGKPLARLTAAIPPTKPKRKFGQNVMGITFHSPDGERDIPLEYFPVLVTADRRVSSHGIPVLRV